jgi:hypothetical protein
MLLAEIYDKAAPGFSEPSADNSVPKLSDVRKTRLTLAHINSLRMMNDVRKFEEEHRMDDIHRQYGAKSAV